MVPASTARIRTRDETRNLLEALRLDVQKARMHREGESERIALGNIEYVLLALLGLTDWPTQADDRSLLPDVLHAIERRDPDTARWLQERASAHRAEAS